MLAALFGLFLLGLLDGGMFPLLNLAACSGASITETQERLLLAEMQIASNHLMAPSTPAAQAFLLARCTACESSAHPEPGEDSRAASRVFRKPSGALSGSTGPPSCHTQHSKSSRKGV